MQARPRSAWALLLLVPAAAACSDPAPPAGAYDVHLATDPCTLAAADEIAVTIFDDDGALVEEIVRQLDGADLPVMFPTGVRVAAGSGDAVGFRLVAEMRGAGVPINRVGASATYVHGELSELRLLFDDACLGVDCGEGRTCLDGACADDFMPGTAAPHGMREVCPPIVYVDARDGEDTTVCGAIDAPCASIQRAVDQSSIDGHGAVINVHGGRRYTSSDPTVVEVRTEDGGSTRSPLVIRAWPGTGAPVIDGQSVSRKAVEVINASHVVLSGLELTGALEHGIAINASLTRFVSVRDCVIHGNGIAPPIDRAPAGLIVNNEASDILIERSTFRDNVSSVATEPAEGVRTVSGARIVLRDNVVTGNDNGIRANAMSTLTVEGNVVVGNGGIGILVDGGSALVAHNRVCDHDEGIVLTGGATLMDVERNSVAGAATNGIRVGARPARVQQNIVAFVEGTGIFTELGDIEDSHNLYFGNGTDFDGFTPDQPSTDVLADPGFVDAAACDLGLQPGSPALDAGPTGGPIGAR